jgi:hypothetical protein
MEVYMARRTLPVAFAVLAGARGRFSQDFWEEIGNLDKGSIWSLAVANEERTRSKDGRVHTRKRVKRSLFLSGESGCVCGDEEDDCDEVANS